MSMSRLQVFGLTPINWPQSAGNLEICSAVAMSVAEKIYMVSEL
jgi:hypothetical protein